MTETIHRLHKEINSINVFQKLSEELKWFVDRQKIIQQHFVWVKQKHQIFTRSHIVPNVNICWFSCSLNIAEYNWLLYCSLDKSRHPKTSSCDYSLSFYRANVNRGLPKAWTGHIGKTKPCVPVVTVGTPAQTHAITDMQTKLTTAGSGTTEATVAFTTSDMELLYTLSLSNTFALFSGFYGHTRVQSYTCLMPGSQIKHFLHFLLLKQPFFYLSKLPFPWTSREPCLPQ